MATLRELKGRIGSVASSEKITGAMKMISSAKMHKAEMSLKKLLPYRNLIEGIIGNLIDSDAEFTSPLTQEREVRRITIVVFGSDDGLCGAYNVNVYKELIVRMAELRKLYGADLRFTLMPVGAKIAKAVKRLAGNEVEIKPSGVNSKTAGDDVRAFLETLHNAYISGDTDRIDVLYMHFHSVSRQRPVQEQLIPVVASTFASEGVERSSRPFLFEPSPAAIFVSVIPMFLLAVMQEVFTENRASEQAARVMAMQSANDNAKKLLESLQLEFNKLRQQSITTELLDIVGGQTR
nr:ATP synthase F1 subunit gamma [Bacteroides sp.]